MADAENPPRNEFEFKIRTDARGDLKVKMIDRINVDDVFMYLVDQHLYRLVSKQEPDNADTVSDFFKDSLLKERFTAGQN